MINKEYITISGKKRQCYIIEINKEDYEICNNASSNLWANSKTGFYGSGILNKKDDPRRTERIGLLGEMAFSKLSGLPYDFTYKVRGKPQDFSFAGQDIDVKTSAKYPEFEAGLIYAQSEKGKDRKIKPDYFVFSYIMEDNRELKLAKICFLGYINKGYLDKLTAVPARQGFHKNFEVPFIELEKLDKLLNKIKKHESN